MKMTYKKDLIKLVWIVAFAATLIPLHSQVTDSDYVTPLPEMIVDDPQVATSINIRSLTVNSPVREGDTLTFYVEAVLLDADMNEVPSEELSYIWFTPGVRRTASGKLVIEDISSDSSGFYWVLVRGPNNLLAIEGIEVDVLSEEEYVSVTSSVSWMVVNVNVDNGRHIMVSYPTGENIGKSDFKHIGVKVWDEEAQDMVFDSNVTNQLNGKAGEEEEVY